ncbi:hypothetical protein [Salisediminibacterium halotolerans]|uniref:hypothetical protein n=1 Tax=Salisediminibacterium halotolerans TaxID=517425 RepID=UPI00116F2C71|nr:hypothetical protein [Salisediminibacterium halotolerans]GEL07103.1 hypothetical protein SHA02_05190 [Salisediminibacterium halotolerans]
MCNYYEVDPSDMLVDSAEKISRTKDFAEIIEDDEVANLFQVADLDTLRYMSKLYFHLR